MNAPRGAKVAERPEVQWIGLGLPGCRRGKTGGLPAEEALPAIHGTALSRLERNRGVPPALRAGGHGLRFGEATTAAALTLGFTSLAALGFVLEVFVVEEVLFSRRKYKFCRTVYTLENSILKLRHNLCPVVLPELVVKAAGPRSRRRFTRSPGDSSSGFVCEPAPAWLSASLPASSRKSVF